ncbi:MAG: tape measure protein [Bacteroidota bacterium]
MEKTEYVISLKDLFTNAINNASNATDKFEGKVSSLQSTIAKIGATIGISAMAKGIFDAGVNMEGLNISLKTMLGSKSEADKLVAQMVKFASTTPFSQSEVQTAGKQLLAYGIEAKNIVPTLKQLGDVSAGLSQPIGEIAYLYGTIKTQGKAMTVDIRQFANRGIPIYEELAKVTGKTGNALQKYIEDGRVGFPEIQKAFENMSGAGGKFANLTSELAQSTGGQWSNTKDLLEQLAVTVFNDLQPSINWFIGGMQEVIQEAKEVVKWIKENITVIKTLAIAVAAAIATYKIWQGVIKLNVWYTGLSTAAIVTNTLVTEGWTAAQVALNIAMTANPIGIVIVAIAALAASVYLLIQNYQRLKEEYESGLNNSIKKAADDEKKYVQELAQSYEKLGQSKKQAQETALNYEKTMVDAELVAAKKGVEEAREILKKTNLLDKSEGWEKVRAATRVLNVISSKRNSLYDKDIFSTGSAAGSIKDMKGAAGVDTAKAPKHTVITINIDKLIEKFTIATNTVSEGAQSVKEQMVKALIEAVNDSQIIAGV